MGAVMTQRLVELARAIEQAQRGQKTALCQAAAAELGITLTTVYRKLKELTVKTPRKRRADAGTSSLTREEAEWISNLWIRSIRKNDKQLSSLDLVVERLRSNGKILAGRVDTDTGEVRLLSTDAIARALRAYTLHPDQLLRPTPAVELRSLHPNHCWQIDASLSSQFYLGTDGARAIDRSSFYDGKPQNLRRIERQRLWRYVITDHYSGTIFVTYVLGAESAENLCGALISAMQKRGETDPFHGVPSMIMTDPGAAMTSAMFRNLCRALGIELIINQVGNARAKGQVEQAHNLVERQFESGLMLMQKPSTLDEINALAGRWMRHFNATAIHSRHGRSRYGVWMTITQDQLRIAPPADVCRELAIAEPVTRKVDARLRINFNGEQFDVSSVPGLMVGDPVLVTRNPWRDGDTAQLVLSGPDGREHYHVVPRIERDAAGFATTARTIGAEYRALPETEAETTRKRLDRVATGTDTIEAAEKAKKSGAVLFGGEIDPFKEQATSALPAYMPKRGTEVAPRVTVSVEIRPLTHIEAAKLLRRRLGSKWSAESLAWLKVEYPEGVPEADLDAIVNRLQEPQAKRPSLRLVGGE